MKYIFWKCGGGNIGDKYGYGVWTGKDKDLLCIKECKTNEEAEKCLSPICSNRLFAFIGFVIKMFQPSYKPKN